MKPLITALIDTYNHEGYIEKALVSVLEQGLSPAELEIVVVDDGSTDGTPGIIKKFAPRVKHLRKTNGGQASAFNAAFPEVRGQIVATLDGDDWWARGKLAAVLEALERNQEIAAVGHGYYEFHEETEEAILRVPPARLTTSISTPEAAQAAGAAWSFLLMGALTVRRQVMEWALPIPEEMVFMADSAIQVAAIIRGAMVLEEPLFYYRYHSQNLYAIDPENRVKLRRRCEMAELAYGRVYRMLTERGIPAETAYKLLEWGWIDAKRKRLGTFGGSRLETFQTEMQDCHATYVDPGRPPQLLTYLIIGPAALLLPARRFYDFRKWLLNVRFPVWHFLLDITRPVRSVLGLRSKKPV
jgi:glycosyltransferase involved in cell wall biosynthesis